MTKKIDLTSGLSRRRAQTPETGFTRHGAAGDTRARGLFLLGSVQGALA